MKKIITAVSFLICFNGLMAQYFQPVWETPFSPMNVYITSAELNGVPISATDEIGIFDIDGFGIEFCVGAIILTQPITPENFVQIICSMDDETTPGEPNGFTQGNDFIFRYWIQSTGEEIEGVVFSFPYPGYDEHFTSLGTAIVSLSATAVVPDTHTITINQGWTGISSYLVPVNPDIVQLMASIQENLLIIHNLDGQYYQPEGNNTLINWDYTKGYMIKVDSPVQLNINGTIPENKTIQLEIGWNLIPVLSVFEVLIEDLFSGNIDKVQIIKEAIGWYVYWPEKEIQTLTELTPGKSYLVKMNQSAIITFPE